MVEQVQLVVILCVPPLPRLHNLRDNLLSFGRKMLRLDLFGHALSNSLLLRRMGEDG